ncbi:MAG: adenylate/guanylate cyclase domain-containing protein, partial [Desulfatitalea sp.]
VLVTLCIYLGLLAAQATPLLDGLENGAYDLRMRIWRTSRAMPDEVVLILIDEASLSAMEPVAGRWPWSREVHASIIEFLSLSGAKRVVFDVLFSEATSGTAAGISASDLRLVQATREAGNVVHACQLVRDAAFWHVNALRAAAAPPPNFTPLAVQQPAEWPLADYTTAYWPYPTLAEAAGAIGVAAFSPDADGVYRRAELLFKHKATFLPALAMLPLWETKDRTELRIDAGCVTIKTPARKTAIPLDRHGYFPVNLYGRYSAFSFSGVYLSLVRLLSGETADLPVRPFEFKDKTVFIGASAAGVEDLKNTSLGYRTPGVLLHASIYGNILTGDFLRQIPATLDSAILLLAISATAAAIFLSPTLKQQLLLCLGLLALLTGTNLLLFGANRYATLAPAITGILLTYASSFTWIGFSSGKEKRKIKRVLGQYVSPAILATVLADPKDALMSAEVGQRETLTMMFCDLRSFATIAEQHAVEQVVALLNRYLAAMVDVIFEHQGTLDKFIGDAIMAFWGAPIRDGDHAYKATTSAMAMQKALAQLNLDNCSRRMPELKMGIGLHTAEVILGNIGSQKKLDYTVIGDGVNLTSRLEGLSKFYGCPILISQETYGRIKERICCRIVDHVKVKGRDTATFIYEPLNSSAAPHPDDAAIATLAFQGFELYLGRRFQEAAACHKQILALRPADPLSLRWIDRCTQYGRTPPDPGWDGVCIFDAK